jgi:hypothetical protein
VVRFRLQEAFNENRQFRLEQRPNGAQINRLRVLEARLPAPGLAKHSQNHARNRGNTEKFALALLSLEILGIARSMSKIERMRSWSWTGELGL